jgi:hypothetical protein
MSLLSNASTNPKTRKKLEEFGYEGVIHHMCPDKLADGKHTVCAWSTPGCRASCLNTAGRSQITGPLDEGTLQLYMIHRSRTGKTLEWINDRQGYADRLVKELVNLEERAIKKGYQPVARLNGTSDIPWENWIDMEALPNVQFYDYTKSYDRMQKWLRGTLPSNYYLTYSNNEYTTNAERHFILAKGGTVAVVFRDEVPWAWHGRDVINGDEHDFRFRDPKGVYVGLTAKGRAKKDDTGFVVR